MKSPLSPVALATALAAPALATWMHRAQDPDPLLGSPSAVAQDVAEDAAASTAQDLDLEWLGGWRAAIAGQAVEHGDYEHARAAYELAQAQELDPDNARRVDELRARLDAQRADLEAERAALEARRAELEARFAEMRRHADEQRPREEDMRTMAVELDRLREQVVDQQATAERQVRAAHEKLQDAQERIARARVEQEVAEEYARLKEHKELKEQKEHKEHKELVESLLREKLAGLPEKETLEVHKKLAAAHEKIAQAHAGQQVRERWLAEVMDHKAALEARLAEELEERMADPRRSPSAAPGAGGGAGPGVAIYSSGSQAPSASAGAAGPGVTIIVQNGDVHVYTDGRGGPPLVATGPTPAPFPGGAAGGRAFDFRGAAPRAGGFGTFGPTPQPGFDPRPTVRAEAAPRPTANRFFGARRNAPPQPGVPVTPSGFPQPLFRGRAVAPSAPLAPAPPPAPPGGEAVPEPCPSAPEAQQPASAEPSVAGLFGLLHAEHALGGAAPSSPARAALTWADGSHAEFLGQLLAASPPPPSDPLAATGPDSILAEILALARELKSDVGSLRSELQELRREVERAPLR